MQEVAKFLHIDLLRPRRRIVLVVRLGPAKTALLTAVGRIQSLERPATFVCGGISGKCCFRSHVREQAMYVDLSGRGAIVAGWAGAVELAIFRSGVFLGRFGPGEVSLQGYGLC